MAAFWVIFDCVRLGSCFRLRSCFQLRSIDCLHSIGSIDCLSSIDSIEYNRIKFDIHDVIFYTEASEITGTSGKITKEPVPVISGCFRIKAGKIPSTFATGRF